MVENFEHLEKPELWTVQKTPSIYLIKLQKVSFSLPSLSKRADGTKGQLGCGRNGYWEGFDYYRWERSSGFVKNTVT